MDNKIKEFYRNDRVKLTNNMEWDCHFHSDMARKDIMIPAMTKTYSLLTMDVVEEEIMKQNIDFVGKDGLGNHAAISIDDPEQYEYLFRCKDETKHFSRNTLMELIKINNKTKFQEAVNDNIVCLWEAKICLYYMC
ncbi:hypothetical protein [Ruminococcus sp. 5_1_39BFAA]|uniref:hypothetical protein n=1 Tax=Ruminococcus sp. 5_1_39BFAA TaxID=457412 RepID=UPI003569CB96